MRRARIIDGKFLTFLTRKIAKSISTNISLQVLELTRLGSILQYVTENPGLVSPTYEIVIWASQIATGNALEMTSNSNLPLRFFFLN